MTFSRRFQRLFDRLFPFECQGCGAETDLGMELCGACESTLPWLLHGCDVCSRPLKNVRDNICGHCMAYPPPYERLLALFTYESDIRQRIIEMKFRRSTSATRLLGELMTQAAIAEFDRDSVLIPVPMHRHRLRQRGYNQSLELARVMAGMGEWTLDMKSLVKHRHTPPQTGLGRSARRRNLGGAFSVTTSLEGRSILLVDDVVTTDSTVNQCTKDLLKAGAGQVNVITLARAVS